MIMAKQTKKVKTSYPGDDVDTKEQEKYEELPAQNAENAVSSPELDAVRAKLRKKYYLLRNDKLNAPDLESLKEHVGRVLGLGKAQLEHDWLNL
jgi:hypothetical protein